MPCDACRKTDGEGKLSTHPEIPCAARKGLNEIPPAPSMKNPPDFTVFVDFDATLIKENFLVQWVLFSILNTRLPLGRRLLFMFKSFLRGIASIAASRFQRGSEWAVRVAYRTFEGIREEEIDEFINHRKTDGYFINLNRNTLNIIAAIDSTIRRCLCYSPKIVIYSQGSSEYAIRTFLGRRDVRMEFQRADIMNDPINSISIRANSLNVVNGVLTGALLGEPVTKHKRVKELFENFNHFVFIGDDDDEALIKSMGINDGRFINHTKHDVRDLERVMTDILSMASKHDRDDPAFGER